MAKFNEYGGTKAIVNALLCDGSGQKSYLADVVIEGDLIKAVAKTGELNLTGIPTYDAKGKILAPGFIDVHSHSDVTAMMYPECDSKISQGVTTEVIGNCGLSSAAILLDMPFREAIAKRLGEEPDWYDVRTYGEAMTRRRVAVNLGVLVGHNTVRRVAMGIQNKPVPTPTEMTMMKELVQRSLDQGALGFSSGLYYMPGKFSSTEEVCELASLLKGTGKPYTTHMRDEAENIIAAIKEAGEIARAGDGILQISHLKTQGPGNWHLMDEVIAVVKDLQKSGLKVTADRYPYLYYGTSLQAEMSKRWSMIPEIRKFLLAHPDKIKEAAAELDRNGGEHFSIKDNGVVIRSGRFPENERIIGRSLDEISRDRNMTIGEAYVKVMIDSDVMPQAAFRGMCRENLDKLYSNGWVFPGSDGYSYPFDYSIAKEHPRCFGTFPRFFRMVSHLDTTENTIARMTALPAKTFNLKYRGLVKAGYYADLTVFDPDRYDAPEDYSDPHHPATGVELVMVSGNVAFEECNPTKRGRFGRFLKA